MADNPQVQLLPGLVEGGSADPGAAAGAADPAAAAAAHPPPPAAAAAAIAVQDVPIYSQLTRSRLSSALAMSRRATAVARHTGTRSPTPCGHYDPYAADMPPGSRGQRFFFALGRGSFLSNFPSRN